MRFSGLIVLGFCVLCGCSKIDFILQNSSPFSILDGVTSYVISGDNVEYINEALIKNIGTANKEEDVKFVLKVGINEENIKTSRGNTFFPSSVYSILKKKKIRDERLNKKFEKKISKMWFEYEID